MIEIKDVMKSFENKNVLNHLNVTISSGSILFDGKDVYENPDVK